jgi:ParB family transcriptional regulator, chromosome partitioning protein
MSAKAKPRLGKGLGALLGEFAEDAGGSEGEGRDLRTVRVGAIRPNPFQPRREFDEEELAELRASISENGLLQPLVVRPAGADAGKGVEWDLVAGERRWRAVRGLEWREVPAVVRTLDDREMLVLAIVENVQRSNLSPIEEAIGYDRLMDEFDLTQREVAEVVGRERSTVANLLRLLQLPASVQRMLNDGTLGMGHARALLGLEAEQAMAELGRAAADEGWSVREVETRVRNHRTVRKPARGGVAPSGGQAKAASDPHLRKVMTELQRRFATDVRVRSGAGDRGAIEIPFRDGEDFGRIVELLLGRDPGGL